MRQLLDVIKQTCGIFLAAHNGKIMQPEETGSDEKLSAVNFLDDRLEVISEIGRGGMSVVYMAKEKMLERIVAVKVLNSVLAQDPKSVQRFRNEAKTWSGLHHSGIVELYSFGASKTGQLFMVMEYLSGKTLDTQLREQGCLDRKRFESIFVPVLDAMVFAHGNNVVHRDLKPGNIMVVQIDENEISAKVLDFGIAKILDNEDEPNSQLTRGLIGSPLYMSPEQCAGNKVDQRSDIYSLSCIMYESIVGKPPFAGETPMETMYEHLRKSVPRLVEVSETLNIPRELFDVIIRGLAKEPSNRPSSMEHFRQLILAALKKNEIFSKASRKSFSWIHLLQLLGALLLLVSTAFLIINRPKANPDLQVSKKADSKKLVVRKGLVSYLDAADQAGKLRDEGKFDEALPIAKNYLHRAQMQRNEDWIRSGYSLLASIYEGKGDLDNALKFHQLLVDSYSKTASISKDKQWVIYNMCSFLQRHQRASEGIELFKKTIKNAEALLPKEEQYILSVSYNRLSELYVNERDYKLGAIAALKSLQLSDTSADKRAEMVAVHSTRLFYICQVHLNQKERGLKEVYKTQKDLNSAATYDYPAMLDFARWTSECGLEKFAIPAFEICLHMPNNFNKPGQSAEVIAEASKGLEVLRSKTGKQAASVAP